MPDLSIVACLEEARVVRLARVTRLVTLVRLGLLSYVMRSGIWIPQG